MRTTQFLLATKKEVPAEAEIASHRLMIRSGLVRKLASGLYSWLPMGWRVVNKVSNIVRQEMDRAGALEISMPVVQPADLWQESERWEAYGPELLRISDRHQRDFVLGPTHEEVITHIVRNEITSYKQLPLNLYQIQTKFRDEVRPRFGVMRSREFIMKDAYSFHVDELSLQLTYEKMYQAYSNIFERIGLKFRAVDADSGSIGGAVSHEFHVLAESGEDKIAMSSESPFAANVEHAEALAVDFNSDAELAELGTVDTPNAKTIEDVAALLSLPTEQCVKTLIVKASDDMESDLVAIVLRGDHQLNEIKAAKHPWVNDEFAMADETQVQAILGCGFGSIGPVKLNLPILLDRSAANLKNFCCGANQDGVHIINANWTRDVPEFEIDDLRNVVAGDPSPCGKGHIKISRGIEVGHIFQLGDKYSKALNCGVLTESGKHQLLQMGCYGIGITRILAAAIEQNHDDKGIKWPAAIAPFQVAIVPMNMHKSERVKEVAEQAYEQLCQAGVEVLFDDRKERPGVMFNDMELIGIPAQIIIGERNLDNQQVEIANRMTGEKSLVDVNAIIAELGLG